MNIATKANRIQNKINATEKQLARATSRKRQRQLAYKLTTLEGQLEALSQQSTTGTSSRYEGFQFTNFVVWSYKHGQWVEMWKAIYTNKRNNYRVLITRNPDKTITAIAEKADLGEFRQVHIGSTEPKVVLEKIGKYAEASDYKMDEMSARKRLADATRLYQSQLNFRNHKSDKHTINIARYR